MKKIIILSFALIVASVSFAQKIYSTKTAQVRFTPFEKNFGENNQVQSLLNPNNGQVAFSMLIKGIKFDNALLQDHFNENYMESTTFPNAKFQGTISNIKEVDFTKNGIYKVNVIGKLTIHGVTKEINAKGTIEVENGKVTAKSTFKVLVKEYGIKGLYIGEKINSEIEVFVTSKYE